MPLPPWRPRSELDVVVDRWLASGRIRSCLAADRELPASEGAYISLPDDLAPSLADALRARGVDRLYEHQAIALAAARAGKHVVVATPTASGKSLCFHLPVLEALAASDDASAI